MATTLDLSAYSISVDGRELRTRPGESGYARAFQWFLFMLFWLVLHWFAFGGKAKTAPAPKLSPQEHRTLSEMAEDAQENYDREVKALQLAIERSSEGEVECLAEINEITQRMMVAKRELEALRLPEPSKPKPIAAAVYRGVQVCLIISAVAPFLIVQIIRPRVRFDGLPASGTLAITIIPMLWSYRRSVQIFGAVTPACERIIRMPSQRAAMRGTPYVDVGFVWMIRLTAQPVNNMTLQQGELRIKIGLFPDKGMVGLRLPRNVTEVLRFFEGVTGIQHDRIMIQDVTDVNPLAGAMNVRLEVHSVESGRLS